MKIINYPDKNSWPDLIQRPVFENESFSNSVRSILNDVKINKDQALLKFSEEFDKVKLSQLQVSEQEIKDAAKKIDIKLKSAIQKAKENIECFHKSQIQNEPVIETSPGVKCWRKNMAIEKVGLYIPGGTAPLFSTVLMLAVPAKLAGCKELVLCSPPDKNGNIHPAILYTASLTGVTKIYKTGGAQAIAAMAYGTESIPQVYKIFGPGNQYVTKAKELVQTEGIAIDMPAGPSEVLIIADRSSVSEFVAADLLSQAEHGPDSQVILLSDDKTVVNKTFLELEKQINELPRAQTARQSLAESRTILFNTIEECIDFSNLYAPEHLIIASENAELYQDKIVNAGSVFLGNYSCESAGDYASGTNHTLPTNGYAKNYSGVSIDSFVKKVTFQKLDEAGIKSIGRTIEIMAEAEGLIAHKNAVSIRLKTIKNV